MRIPLFLAAALLCISAARAGDIQIPPERLVEGISKSDEIRPNDPKLGLGMPQPDSGHWGHIFEGFFRSTPDTPEGVTFYNSDTGFALNFGKPHGKGFDWYKIVYADEQASKEGKYKTEVVLITAACDPPAYAVVETDRFSVDGKLVSKTVNPIAQQKFQPIMDAFGRFDASGRNDIYLTLVLQAGICNSMAE